MEETGNDSHSSLKKNHKVHFKASEMINMLEIDVLEVYKEVIKLTPFMSGCQSTLQTSLMLTPGYAAFH